MLGTSGEISVIYRLTYRVRACEHKERGTYKHANGDQLRAWGFQKFNNITLAHKHEPIINIKNQIYFNKLFFKCASFFVC